MLRYLLDMYSVFGIEMRILMLLGMGALVVRVSGRLLEMEKDCKERKREVTEVEKLREQVRILEDELRVLRGEESVKKERTTQLRIVGGSGNEW